MQVVSLFSGIGGFELAADWMGWQNIVSCEINPFGQQVLKHHFPNSYHHTDIHTLSYAKILKKSAWNPNEPTLVCGGFPCQPYSLAGKRKGTDDERHLWPEMLRVIREVKPRWVVGENVLGIVSWSEGMVFEQVQADLESEGYEVQPYVLPACAVNAPHRRDRVWFVAFKSTERTAARKDSKISRKWAIADTDGKKCNGGTCASERKGIEAKQRRYGVLAPATRLGLQWPTPHPTNTGTQNLQRGGQNRVYGLKLATDTNQPRLERFGQWQKPAIGRRYERLLTWPKNQFSFANANGRRQPRKEHGQTSQLNPLFVGEMMGFPNDWLVSPFLSGETNQ